MNKIFKKSNILLFTFFIIFVFTVVISYYYYKLNEYSVNLELELAGIKSNLEKTIKELHDTVVEKNKLAQQLVEEKNRMDFLSSKVAELSGAVELIEKVQRTDKELLQKYSKIYFLSENYIPNSLTKINEEFLYNPYKDQYFHTKALPYLESLMKAAAQENIDLKIVSAYRSFGEQASLKSGYKMIYGLGANKFSADQGYSEHQLGTTVDFTDSKIGSTLAGFDKTDAYQWLQKEAYKYGFILSYPEGNKYYLFEPWHWRFVGRELAEKLHNEGKYFYDLDQREINTYLVSLFD
jgi:D-alanyl-D-alanine carboxypeptidase